MTFTYRKHHYTSQVWHNLKTMLWVDNYRGFKWRYTNKNWFSHGDDCCDYWTPINDPKAQRALILDNELGLERINHGKDD